MFDTFAKCLTCLELRQEATSLNPRQPQTRCHVLVTCPVLEEQIRFSIIFENLCHSQIWIIIALFSVYCVTCLRWIL